MLGEQQRTVYSPIFSLNIVKFMLYVPPLLRNVGENFNKFHWWIVLLVFFLTAGSFNIY